MEIYRTVAGFGRGTIVVRKSKFIASVDEAQDESQAAEFIESRKREFRDATHNTFAYVVGDGGQIQRYSDDGEPSGTAGVPILELIRSLSLTSVVIVVTRYFGGTLLGTGGLIRAYGQAAKEGLRKAGVVERVLHHVVRLTTDYPLAGKIQNELHVQGFAVLSCSYTDKVAFDVIVQPGRMGDFRRLVDELTSGTAVVSLQGERYVETPVAIE